MDIDTNVDKTHAHVGNLFESNPITVDRDRDEKAWASRRVKVRRIESEIDVIEFRKILKTLFMGSCTVFFN